MEHTLIHRIKEVIFHKAPSARNFAAEIGFNYSTLNNYLTGRRKSIDCHLLAQIVSAYEDISSSWLLTGKGEMWSAREKTPGKYKEKIEELQEELEKAKETIYTLKGQNEILQEMIGLKYQAQKA